MPTVHEMFPMKVLVVDGELGRPTAAGRALEDMTRAFEARGVEVVGSTGREDACAIAGSDAAIQCAMVDWDLGDDDHAGAREVLAEIRANNGRMPVFLLADRTAASAVPSTIMEQADDFIWLLEDTPEFVTGRVVAAMRRYQEQILPPMFQALIDFSNVYEYSWHTPGHTGGTAFLKSPAGRAFFSYFGEHMLRSDLSISVGELGSLLDHSGPIGAGEKYAARVFGADRTYYVTNGTSTSNRVVVMAAVTRGETALCDRNCHKSIEHAMTLSGAVPTYLVPTRNHLGIIGPVLPEHLTAEAIRDAVAANPLAGGGTDPAPKLSILTNSTYDGLCYNIARVEELLGQSVDRMLFDEAWYGYARFNPIYRGRFAMHGERSGTPDPGTPTVFATQSTHKLLAALSQASMIHVRDGRQPIPHDRFNEAFMMHASTSPQYAIIASNDVSAAMMDGPGGQALTDESIHEAIAFRQMVARLHAEFAGRGDWFFDVWQPPAVADGDGRDIPFHEAPADRLAGDPDCWMLAPGADWHGFGALDEGYCMLDPIKVTLVTPGAAGGSGDDVRIPAPVLSSYLDANGIEPEKTATFSILFLFSLGITKGKWGTLVNALLRFKQDYDANAPLAHVLPRLAESHPGRYGAMGLRDLCHEMCDAMQELSMADTLEKAFSTLPEPVASPVAAYERLVRDEVESVPLAQMANRTVATGIVPYPPGIPLLMPGEATGPADGAALAYLSALEAFDARFPGFEHDTHGIEAIDGKYRALCLVE